MKISRSTMADWTGRASALMASNPTWKASSIRPEGSGSTRTGRERRGQKKGRKRAENGRANETCPQIIL
jgi:hypothetical protein